MHYKLLAVFVLFFFAHLPNCRNVGLFCNVIGGQTDLSSETVCCHGGLWFYGAFVTDCVKIALSD